MSSQIVGLPLDTFHTSLARWSASGCHIMAAAAGGQIYTFHAGTGKVPGPICSTVPLSMDSQDFLAWLLGCSLITRQALPHCLLHLVTVLYTACIPCPDALEKGSVLGCGRPFPELKMVLDKSKIKTNLAHYNMR